MSKKQTLRLVLAVIVLSVSSLACTALESFLPDTSSEPAPAVAESILVRDDFSDKNSGWEDDSFDGGDVGYHNGKYRVTSVGEGSTMWGAAGLNFQDLTINIEATQIVGPSNNNNDYGIVCRLQRDGGGYYGLISGDGFYAILRESGENDFTYLVDWTESRLIKMGNSTNHLGLACQGTRIQLFVNDKLVAETHDSMFSSGDVGLTVTSYEPEFTEVHFDNLTVR